MDVIGVGGINFENQIARFSSRGMTTWVRTLTDNRFLHYEYRFKIKTIIFLFTRSFRGATAVLNQILLLMDRLLGDPP